MSFMPDEKNLVAPGGTLPSNMRIIIGAFSGNPRLIVRVVINTEFGGFSLSRAAMDEVVRRKGWQLDEDGFVVGKGEPPHYLLERYDPDMVAVVEEIGVVAAGGEGSKLQIVEADSGFVIEDFDGRETIRY